MLRLMRIDSGSRVLITGASRGIGRALTDLLAQRGCSLGLVARNADQLDRIAAGSAPAFALPADVGDYSQIEAAVASFIERAGGLDLLVVNAGVAWYGPVRDMPVEEAERMTSVNWLGTVYTVKAALPHLLDRAEGHIAIVSSGAGHRSFPYAAVYGATKFAQR